MKNHIQSHIAEIVVVLLLIVIGCNGFAFYKMQTMQNELKDQIISSAPSSSSHDYQTPEVTQDDIQSIQNQLDSISKTTDSTNSTVFDIKYGLR